MGDSRVRRTGCGSRASIATRPFSPRRDAPSPRASGAATIRGRGGTSSRRAAVRRSAPRSPRRRRATPCRAFTPMAFTASRRSIASAVHSHDSTCAIAASRISAAFSTPRTFSHDSSVDHELVVGREEERGLIRDLHQGRRALLRELDRGFEHAHIEPRAVLLAGEGQHRRREVAQRERANVLAVQPFQFLGIEGRRRLVHTIEIERRDQLVEREHLALVGWRPTEQREVVDNCCRQVSRRRGTPRR